jgi:homoaconitate hydratase
MFKQPQLQIGRDYTPLPPLDEGPNNEHRDESLRFLIRKDPHGEVSRYLHGLPLGAEIEIRGPQIECQISSDAQDILFIAGGTGIAPALQAAYTLLRRSDATRPRIHILWASRKREDCLGGVNDTRSDAPTKSPWWKVGRSTRASSPSPSPVSVPTGAIVQELQTLKSQYPGQLTVDYFIDEENTFISKNNIRSFTESVSSDNKGMILVSGPEGFISYMAGPKIWAEGRQLQGAVQGIIRELDLKGWSVWKL